MPYDGDVIVIGSGAGGATFAYACARAGKSVLLLERGRRHAPDEQPLDERAALIEKTEQARARIESMISRLRAMETRT